MFQEENQRECGSTHTASESVALSVKNYEYKNNDNQSTSHGKAENGRSQNNYKKNNADSSLVCDVFHLTGHTRDKCFRVHGYPSWHRLYGKPKPRPKTAGKSP